MQSQDVIEEVLDLGSLAQSSSNPWPGLAPDVAARDGTNDD